MSIMQIIPHTLKRYLTKFKKKLKTSKKIYSLSLKREQENKQTFKIIMKELIIRSSSMNTKV